MTEHPAPDEAEEEAAPPLRVRFRIILHRAGHKAHKAENWSHLAYFAMLVTSLEYKIAALACLCFGLVAMLGGEEA